MTLRKTVATACPWNANIHYHSLILRAIPADAKCVLDVGCGDGILSAQVTQASLARVIGLDLDAGVLERAGARHPDARVEWRHGDVFSVPFERGSFDAVVSVAALHHMDAQLALTRFAELVRPGGIIAVVGIGACDWWDWPYEAFAEGARRTLGFVYRQWKHSAPMVWPPPATYGEMKRISSSVLPGVRYRRLLLGRYSLIWRKPM